MPFLRLGRPAIADALPVGHNGGKGQINLNVPATIYGEYPFLNLVNLMDNWIGTGTDNGDAVLDPSWLDDNGYPLESELSRDAFGCKIQGQTLPNSAGRLSNVSNPMVLTWEGNAELWIGNASITDVSGSHSAVLNGYGYSDGKYHGRYVWYPTYASDGSFSFELQVRSISSGSYVDKIKLYYLDDETDILAGKIFGARFLQRMSELNFGVIRFMNWGLTNVGNYSTWDLRKNYDHYTWQNDQYRADLYPGDIMTNSGGNYSLTTGSFTLADKLTMHVHFNADATTKGNGQGGYIPAGFSSTLTKSLEAGTGHLKFGWPSHGIPNGTIVHMLFSGTRIDGCDAAQNYYVVSAGANDFKVALTSGGTPIAPASVGSDMAVFVPQTLSLNGSDPIPIADKAGSPFEGRSVIGFSSGKNIYGTVVYDAGMNRWLLSGAREGEFSAGLNNGVPVEVWVALALELRAHISVCPGYLHMDSMTDYVPQLATYLYANRQPWQKIFWEAGNEIFNTATILTNYAFNKAWVHWQLSDNLLGRDNWIGMCNSTVGQAVAAVFGLGNMGTTYEMQVGLHTDGMVYPVANPSTYVDLRMTAERYVTVGPTQSGYTRTPASDWVSSVCPATYHSPVDRYTNREIQLAFDYYVTSVGNPTQQMADLNEYVDGLASVNTQFTIPYVRDRWKGSLDWARRFVPSAKLFAYEGGWSPDTMASYWLHDGRFGFNSAARSSASSTPPTRASSCVVTIDSTLKTETGRQGGSAISGNPCAVGMLVSFDGTGMPELYNNSGSVTFDGTTPDATWTGHNLHPNEVVIFSGFNPPGNVNFNQRYYVLSTNLTTNTFRFSATRGGTAITPDTAGTKNVLSAFVVTNVAGNAVTIDCDSSGFAVPTGSMNACYPGTFTYVNQFREQCLYATSMYTQLLSSFSQFEAEGGEFPSQFLLAGTGTTWTLITPDIYGTTTEAFDAWVTYNH